MNAQTELFPSSATKLDSSGGVIDIDPATIGIDPDQRMNITIMAGRMGLALSEVLPKNTYTDQALRVYRDDFRRAAPAQLSSGLYMPYGDPRRRNAKQLAVIGNEESGLQLPGMVGRNDGVVVSEQEYIWIVRNAADLAKAVDAKARRANLANTVKEEVEEIAGRSVAHTMQEKRSTLFKLEDRLVGQQIVLRKVARDARIVWRTTYKSKDINEYRTVADELIHETARIACINLEFGTTVVNALHRAITSNLYRRGSSREIAQSWRRYTSLVGLYINAKLGKIDQSRRACDRQLNMRAHYLEVPSEI